MEEFCSLFFLLFFKTAADVSAPAGNVDREPSRLLYSIRHVTAAVSARSRRSTRAIAISGAGRLLWVGHAVEIGQSKVLRRSSRKSRGFDQGSM